MTRLALLVTALALAIAAPAHAMVVLPDVIPPVAGNPANALTNEPIEPFGYEGATHCTPHAKRPGITAFEAWMGKHTRGVSWGSYRCEKWGKHEASLHAENRAVDWHLDVSVPRDARAARKIILEFLAPDKHGEPAALARRMGIEEIIWDCGYLSIGASQFSKYSVCYDKHGKRIKHVDPTAAHMNHLHIGFTTRGANGRTSFWR